MKDRILHFLNAEQLTPTQLADKIGVQRSGISHILSGRNKPSFDFIEKMLLTFPSLNAEWFITGKGDVYKYNQEEDEVLENLLFSTSSEEALKQVTVNVKKEEPKVEKVLNQEINNNLSREVEQIVIFYTNKTFKVYCP
ncbi:MAG: helix-turn-helix domain-containing protein [Prevotellaceae bacterium]|jgi:transcriptional regulator with XRE-family HTH domain|nr:helix-turn-helix domain-containing protein [Prevotellaceae bacterium]